MFAVRRLLKRLVSGKITPDEFRDQVMTNIEPSCSEDQIKKNRKFSRQFDHICSFEDIYPGEDQLKDTELFITRRLSHKEFNKYIVYKYGTFRKQV
jgi:hypothetical protein